MAILLKSMASMSMSRVPFPHPKHTLLIFHYQLFAFDREGCLCPLETTDGEWFTVNLIDSMQLHDNNLRKHDPSLRDAMPATLNLHSEKLQTC